MSVSIGDIFTFLKLDKSNFDKGLDTAQKQVSTFGSNVASSLTNALSFATGQILVQGLNSIVGGLQQAGAAAFDSVKNYEGLNLSLEALIARQLRAGDASISMADALAAAGPMAKQLLEWSQKLAIESPFEDDDISKVVQMAGAFRFSVQESKGLIQALVDSAAAGNLSGAAMESATRALGQMNIKGKVSAEELNQLTEAGFGTASTLERMGKTLDDVASGSVSATSFIQAFIQQMGEESEGAAQRTMTSWSGLVSTLSSLATTGLREFFTGLLEPVRGLLEALGNVGAADGFRESLRSLGEIAGQVVAPAIEWLTEKLQGLPAFFDQASGFIQQFRDEMAGLTAGDVMAGLPATLEGLQQQFDKSSSLMQKAHEGTLAKLQEQMSKAQEGLTSKLAEVDEKFANKIADLNERIAETAADYQERLTDLAEEHGKKRADLESKITKAQSDMEEKLTELKADHMRRRRELSTSLMLADSEEEYLRIQQQIKSEDEKYEEQKSSAEKAGKEQINDLKAQLNEEDQEYAKQQGKLESQRAKTLADLDKQLSRVQEEKAKEAAKVQESYDQQVASLQDKITRENELYAQSVADQRAAFEQSKADAIASANSRAAALDQGGLARDLAEQVKAAMAAWNDFKTSAAAVWAEVKKIYDIFQNQGFGAGMSAMAQFATQKLNEISTAINTWVTNPATQEQFRAWGRNAGQALVDGIVSLLTIQGAPSISAGFAGALVNAWVTVNTLPITLATQFVQGFIQSVTSPENVEALKNSFGTVLEAAGKRIDAWAAEIEKLWNTRMTAWGKVITSFDWGKIGKNIVDGIGAGIKSNWDALSDWVVEKTAGLYGIGAGIKSNWDALSDWVAEKTAGLSDSANEGLDAHSPSALFAKKTGPTIPAGIQQGFEAGLPGLRAAISSGMKSLAPTQLATGALAGVGSTTTTISPTFNLGQAPAGFDSEALLQKINNKMLELLGKQYDEV